MEYLITESQYRSLKQVLSEQKVYTDKKKYKAAMDIYNVQKMFYDYFTRNKKNENTSDGSFSMKGKSIKNGNIRFDVEYSTEGNEYDYQKKLVGNTSLSNWLNWPAYMMDFIYSTSIGEPHVSDLYKSSNFIRYSTLTITKNDADVYYKIFSDFKLKDIITSWRHDYGGWDKRFANLWLPVVKPPIKPVYEEPVVVTTKTTSPVVEPIITTTTTTPPVITTTAIEPEKTIIPEPFYDKNTERAVEQYCGVTFVGKKGAGTFDRIHSTKDGKFLADYNKSKSGEWNINRFCKK